MDTSLPPADPSPPALPPDDAAAPVADEVPVAAATAEPEPAAPPAEPQPPAAPSPFLPPIPIDLSRIAQDLQIRKVQVESVVHLLDDGNTAPFIARYRKERTGGLPEEVVRRIHHRVRQLR